MKNIGKKWKDTRHNLFHQFYDKALTMEENVARCPNGIDPDHWTWFIEYHNHKKTQGRQRGSCIGRGEMWTIVHKRKNSSYVNDEAKIVGEKIMNIGCQDGS